MAAHSARLRAREAGRAEKPRVGSFGLQTRTSQGADANAARVPALAAYRDYLQLWKDADRDIPIVKEAKAEYAKLQ
jgi:hypothetical protein